MRYASTIKRSVIKDRLEKAKAQLNKMPQEQREKVLFNKAVIKLSSSISGTPVPETSLFNINVNDFEEDKAILIANSVSRSYVIFDLEQQIEELKLKYGAKHSTVQLLENYIEEFKKSLDGELIPDIEAIGPASVKIVAQATYASPGRRAPKSIILTFMVLSGIFLSVIYAFFIEYLDNTFRTPKEISKHLDIPFLGSIPKRKKGDNLIMSIPNASEKLTCVKAFQRLGDRIWLTAKKDGIKSILITALENFTDASAVIANLGYYLSRDAGKKLLIIDANLKHPSLAKVFDIPGRAGLIDVFNGKIGFEDAIYKVHDKLHLLTTKSSQIRPIKILDTTFMSKLIKNAEDQYDLIFIDCSVNLRLDSEPVMLASFADAVLLIINEGKDRYLDVQLAVHNLRQKEDRPIFTVLNNRKKDIPKILYKVP
jgi:Mrp family chromosome partitioning ATPase